MEKKQLIIAKVADKKREYERNGRIVSTNFLDPTEIVEVETILSKAKCLFYGGYEEAERKILVFGVDSLDIDSLDELRQFIAIILIQKKDKKEISKFCHRDILGSLMGLGIERNVIGDILIDENGANVFILKNMLQYVLRNLDNIGRDKVIVCEKEWNSLVIPETSKREIKTTVPSLRADAIISASIGVSREISAKMIQNQKVKLNHKLLENTSKLLKEGDLLSIRGYGRITLTEIIGTTRKDRIRICVRL